MTLRNLLHAPAGSDLLVCLSFANLCFLNLWEASSSVWVQSFAPERPAMTTLLIVPLLAAILMFGGVLWALLAAFRRLKSPALRRVVEWVSLAAWLVPINVLRRDVLGLSFDEIVKQFGRTSVLLAAAVVSVGILLAFIRWREPVLRSRRALLLICAPLLPVNLAYALWQNYDVPNKAFADEPPAALVTAAAPAPRIVWLIFDQMEQRATFAARPPHVSLPELDRLRSQALYASQVRPPHVDNTMMSIPSMIIGKLVRQALPSGPDELMLTIRGQRGAVPWSEQPSIFSRAREMGLNSALAGWFLPYCRVIGRSLVDCSWEPYEGAYMLLHHLDQLPPAARPWTLLKNQLEAFPGLVRLGLVKQPDLFNRRIRQEQRKAQADAYLRIRRVALDKLVAEPRYDVVLVHWPIPHMFGIYDRQRQEISADETSNYIDNLLLVDRTLGEVRRTMEDAGLWDDSIVLMTSDHSMPADIYSRMGSWTEEEARVTGNRNDRHVPFLLKLRNQRSPVSYDAPFNSVLIHDLLLGLLRGELSSPHRVVGFLDSRRDPPAAARRRPPRTAASEVPDEG